VRSEKNKLGIIKEIVKSCQSRAQKTLEISKSPLWQWWSF